MNIHSWRTGTVQSRQSGREREGKSNRPCSSQTIPRTFRSNRGRVAGQHAQGFLMASRLVGKQQNAGLNNGTQRKKSLEKTISTHAKYEMCYHAGHNLHKQSAR